MAADDDISNGEEPLGDEPLSESQTAVRIPRHIQIPLAIILVVVAGISVYQMCVYVLDPQRASPKELGLSELLIFCLVLLLLALIPWEKLGLRIKKIGALEFETALSGQRKESAQDVVELRGRLEALESRISALPGWYTTLKSSKALASTSKAPSSIADGTHLRNLLLEFLHEYDKWAFSPLRIQKWGGERKGYSELKQTELPRIKGCLRQLLAEGKVRTRISKNGNTLYRA